MAEHKATDAGTMVRAEDVPGGSQACLFGFQQRSTVASMMHTSGAVECLTASSKYPEKTEGELCLLGQAASILKSYPLAIGAPCPITTGERE